VQKLWPYVVRAAQYIELLRQQRRTAEFRQPGKRTFFGLLPESISHEGYSSRAVHSYWDDSFALAGLAGAIQIARDVGEDAAEARFSAAYDEFRSEFLASIRSTIDLHKLDTLPASVEYGDFDPTSNTTMLEPAGLSSALPRAELQRTFDRYWRDFVERAAGDMHSSAFTPYEVRVIGSFVRLARRDRAEFALDWFLQQRQPLAWRQWPEVVRFDRRTPFFVGDLPHTWVGSDYIRSLLDMFAFEDHDTHALVIGAGVPLSWLSDGGTAVHRLRTPFGLLDLRLQARDGEYTVSIGGDAKPPGGFDLVLPQLGLYTSFSANGIPISLDSAGRVHVSSAPQTLAFRYR
jgi:hypothetical protein